MPRPRPLHRALSTPLCLLVASTACQRAAPGAPARPPAPAVVAAEPASAPRPPLALPPWFERPLWGVRDWRDPDEPFASRALAYRAPAPAIWCPGAPLALGPRSAVFEGLYVVQSARGLAGPFAPPVAPAATFVLGDDVFVAGGDGALHRARASGAEGLADFERSGAAPAAARWAAGGRRVVAAGAGRLFVSNDGGASFVARALPTGEPIDALFVREDEAIVTQTHDQARGARATRSSIDGGVSWHVGPALPPLRRDGGFIYGVDESCAGAPAIWAVLASDGRTWVKPPPLDAAEAGRRRARLERTFEMTPELVAHAELAVANAREPKPPAASLARYAGFPICGGRPGGRTPKVARLISPGIDVEGQECAGTSCIYGERAATPPPTATRAYLFHDGLCDPRDALPGEDELCRDGARLVRAPHAAFLHDTSRLEASAPRSVPLPEDCWPRFVTFASGLVVLACRPRDASATTTLYAADGAGEWHLEASLASADLLAASDFEMARDGTAMLASYPRLGPARAWVRAPLPIGALDAWREVSREDAIDYVLDLAGEVLVASAEAPQTLTLVLDAPGKPARVVIANASFIGDLWCVGRKDERVVGLLRAPGGTFQRVAFTREGIGYEGTLLEGADRADPLGRCGF